MSGYYGRGGCGGGGYPSAPQNNYQGRYTNERPNYRQHGQDVLCNNTKYRCYNKDEYDPEKFLPKKNELHTPACAHIKSLYDPFETANANPKWPDGLANYSVGQRHLESREVNTILSDTSDRADFLIALFPGSANWAVVINDSTDEGYSIAGILGTNTSFNYTYDSGSNASQRMWNINTDAFSAWRGVSYAMKLSLISPSESREGYFEAIRVDRATYQTAWGITTGNSENGGGDESKLGIKIYPGYSLPSVEAVASHYQGKHWQANPTFVSGNLKEIDQNVFMLNPSKKDNEFTTIRKVVHDVESIDTQTLYAQEIADGKEFTTKLAVPNYTTGAIRINDYKSDQETLLSDSFDMILIRIHSTGSKLMISTVANQEFLVREQSSFSQYSTPAYSDRQGLEKYMWIRKKYHRLPIHQRANRIGTAYPTPLEK